MKLVIQRVNHACVRVDGQELGRIEQGYVVFLGIAQGDTEQMADKYAEKLSRLRIFPDEEGKSNRSIQQVHGKLLVISQFTLYADCKKGNRPGFSEAEEPHRAKELYEYFLTTCRTKFEGVEQGCFGADMKVELENDGPFTILWDSREW